MESLGNQNVDFAELINNLPIRKIKKMVGDEAFFDYLQTLPDHTVEDLLYDWRSWARPEQISPPGLWSIWLYLAGRGSGKALALDTPIPTMEGWKSMGSLIPGDVIFDESGKQCKVLEAYPVQYNKSCYNVHFSDGAKITADAEHLWFTEDKASRKGEARRIGGGTVPQRMPTRFPQVRTTEEILSTISIQRSDGAFELNHSIPVAKPLSCNLQYLLIDPYFLGIWLGDGDSKGSVITTEDPEILEEILNVGYPIEKLNTPSNNRYTIGTAESERDEVGRFTRNTSIHSFLKDLNLLNNKHIPQIYLRASKSQRLALLQGLMDSDGYIAEGGTCEFTSTKERLALETWELCLSLGLKATIAVGRAMLYGKDCGPKYRVCFTTYKTTPVFRLSRKLNRLKEPGKQAKRQSRRYIKAVIKTESVPVRCITVDSPLNLFLAGWQMIPTHNTRAGAEWIKERVEKGDARFIALVSQSAADARDVMVEGESGILSIYPDGKKPKYEPSKRRIVWPNGAQATIYTAEDPDQLRGPNHDTAWADEIAAFRHLDDLWSNLMLGLRLGDSKCFISTTPRAIKFIKGLIIRSINLDPNKELDNLEKFPEDRIRDTFVTKGTTYDNKENLSKTFMNQIITQYEGTRLGQQELLAKILQDVEGALWNRELLSENRVKESEIRTEDLTKIIVAIDPTVAKAENATETGIIVMGKHRNGHGYTIADRSLIASPDGWAKAAVAAYVAYEADKIVAEKNNGGEMVSLTIGTVNDKIPVKLVWASRGKITRAEPVAALDEQHKLHLVGEYSKLEDELCTYDGEGDSPNRLDAYVWAATELFLGKRRRGLVFGRG